MQISTHEPIALGFDIGGTTTKVGLVSQSGQILAIEKTPTDVETTGLEPFLEKFLSMLRGVLTQAGQPVVGIGGTFLGWIDEARSGPYLCINAPTLHGLNLRKILDEQFGLPVQLIDDFERPRAGRIQLWNRSGLPSLYEPGDGHRSLGCRHPLWQTVAIHLRLRRRYRSYHLAPGRSVLLGWV